MSFCKCPECLIDMIMCDGYPTCDNCGICDISNVQLVMDYSSYQDGTFYYKQNVIYKRCEYFQTILKWITCIEIMNNEKIQEIVQKLKKYKKKSIYELRTWLKSHDYNKMVKYIYSIYKLAYNEVLNPLSHINFRKILKLFDNFNKRYKDQIGKRNQLNYYFIIYKLFEETGISNKNIILPKTYKKLNKQYMKIL